MELYMELYVVFRYKEKYPALTGHALTDALIRDCLGSSDLSIERTGKGKPFIQDPSFAGRNISVSHSEGTFALLVAGENVGLDIQYARDVKTYRIAARLFTEEEMSYAQAGNDKDRFFVLWTRKEAYSKFTGSGMEQIMRREPVLGREDVQFIDLRLEDGCYCSICLERTGVKGGQESDEIQISYRK